MMGIELFAEGLTTNLFLVGLALTVAMLLVRTQMRNRRRSPSAGSTSPARPEPARNRGPQAAQHESWQVEMHDLARELTGRLDSKIALLEGLIRDARHEAARLESLLAQTRHPSEQIVQTPRRRDEGPAGRMFHDNFAPAHQAQSLTAALRAEADGVTPLSDRMRPAEAGTTSSRRFDDIYSLADAGCDPSAIAQQIGAPVGEIELILSLRRQV